MARNQTVAELVAWRNLALAARKLRHVQRAAGPDSTALRGFRRVSDAELARFVRFFEGAAAPVRDRFAVRLALDLRDARRLGRTL